MRALTFINGNGQKYKRDELIIRITSDYINDIALKNIKDQTKLDFKKLGTYGYTAKVTSWIQLTKLLMVYDFKTTFYNNSSYKNTIMLEFNR